MPPQIDTNSIDPTLLPASEEFPQFDKSNERRNAFSAETSGEVKTRAFLPPPTGFEPPRVLPNHNQQFRLQEEQRLRNLGLPLQTPTQPTRYQPKPSQASTKKPARTFDPDKNFKAFSNFFPSKKATHKDYDFSQYFTRKNGVTTPSPATRRQFNSNTQNQLPTGPNATQRPFANSLFNKVASTAASPQTTRRPVVQTVATTQRVNTTPRPPQFASTTKKVPSVTRSPSYYQPQARVNSPTPNQITSPTGQGQKKTISTPANDLLPPHETIKIYDDATTKGPPIYYEWRVPEGLLPPKFDNETDTNSLKRSITEEGNVDNDFQSSETRRYGGGSSVRIQYKDLQKLFAIPEVELELESSGREGYDNEEAVNSFQVKIPYRKDASKAAAGADRYYYLEHAHCNPECHPYFFKPGRCEPCIKLKK